MSASKLSSGGFLALNNTGPAFRSILRWLSCPVDARLPPGVERTLSTSDRRKSYLLLCRARRTWHIALAVVSVLLITAQPASAGPIVITNIDDLQNIQNNLAGDYVLGANIDASITSTWNGGAGFLPIGELAPFTGTLDGQGHTIRNLTINNSTGESSGLFGRIGGSPVSTAYVGNLNLANVNISNVNGSFAGALAGNVFGGRISNVTANGVLSTNSMSSGGGLVGYFRNAEIVNSDSFVALSGLDVNAIGGLVGVNEAGLITGSRSWGAVSNIAPTVGHNSAVGGLVGANGGLVTLSSAKGSIICGGTNTCGGLVGWNPNAQITNSFATGTVTNSSFNGHYSALGGLVGEIDGGSINNAYATGAVAASPVNNSPVGFALNVGGLVGVTNYATLTNSHATGNVNGGGVGVVGGLVGSMSDGYLYNAYATGTVSRNEVGGGLIGANNDGRVQGSFASGAVSGSNLVGGLIGYQVSAGNAITQSFSTGSVTATSPTGSAGGFLGFAQYNGIGGPIWIDQTFSTGVVRATSQSAYTGGYVGYGDLAYPGAASAHSYWDTNASGQLTSTGGGNSPAVSGLTTAQLKSGALPDGFDPTAWSASPGLYPSLKTNPIVAGNLPSIQAASAMLSHLVYLSAADIIKGKLPLGYYMPDGYSVVTRGNGSAMEMGTVGGEFHGIAFSGPDGIVLAFSGTQLDLKSPTTWGDLGLVPWIGAGGGTPLLKQYVDSSALFLSAVQQYANSTGQAVHLAGHSLGGAVAQILGNQTGLPTITFNAPGTRAYMESQGILNMMKSNTNIINYRMAGDTVSVLPSVYLDDPLTQIGEVISLTNNDPHASNDPSNLLGLFANHMCILDPYSTCDINSLPLSDIKPDALGMTNILPLYAGYPIKFLIDKAIAAVAVVVEIVGKVAYSIYSFAVDVLKGEVQTFDPLGSTEYKFATADGNPNFESVTLPSQNDPYDIQALIGGVWVDEGAVSGLSTFYFPEGGVSAFDVLNVDAPDGDVSSFYAGLSFTADGRFTGTITSETAATTTVPEPSSIYLVLLAFSMLILRGRPLYPWGNARSIVPIMN